jgi:hypothetical protein
MFCFAISCQRLNCVSKRFKRFDKPILKFNTKSYAEFLKLFKCFKTVTIHFRLKLLFTYRTLLTHIVMKLKNCLVMIYTLSLRYAKYASYIPIISELAFVEVMTHLMRFRSRKFVRQFIEWGCVIVFLYSNIYINARKAKLTNSMIISI